MTNQDALKALEASNARLFSALVAHVDFLDYLHSKEPDRDFRQEFTDFYWQNKSTYNEGKVETLFKRFRDRRS